MNKKHINISNLSNILTEASTLPLKFYFDDTAINQGYHVTEVRHAAIKSQDCGRMSDTEQWDEITVQLLDGSSSSTQGHMSGSKFLGIVGSALKSLESDAAPYLFFEFAPDNGPIRKLTIESVEQLDEEISVSLGSERAVCKPFQRAKDAMTAAALSGVAIESSGNGCCADGNRSDGSSCCG